jgi:hypothetical protein
MPALVLMTLFWIFGWIIWLLWNLFYANLYPF